MTNLDCSVANLAPSEPLVIVPSIKRRWSGVTSTVFRLLPIQAGLLPMAAFGIRTPDDAPRISFLELLRLSRRTRRVWHARRNIEMAVGLVLRFLLRAQWSMVFTSAAQRCHTRYTRFLLRRMDYVIATSDEAAAYLDVPSHVIMHGVDCARFRPTECKAGLKSACGFSPSRRLVGCFGRVRHQKGTDAFVDAMILLTEAHPDVDAVIVGAVKPEHMRFLSDLKARVRAAGLSHRIHFLGEQPDEAMPCLFAMLDVFVSPARWEGFGMTVLEAMASGVPVVASDVGAFARTVTDGHSGTIIPSPDPELLRNAVHDILRRPCRAAEMGCFARQDMLARFGIETEALALVSVYKALLGLEEASDGHLGARRSPR